MQFVLQLILEDRSSVIFFFVFESVTSAINISSETVGVTEDNPLTSTISVELKSPDVAVAPPERPDPEAVVIVTAVMSPPKSNHPRC